MSIINKDWPGFIISQTTIAVDYWPKKYCSNVTHCFLTHCHTDHTKNLDKYWSGPTIYCSKITRKLLMDLHNVPSHCIEVLEMNQTHVMNVGEYTFNVTLLDANHCYGAVMYLFEGEHFGHILATGDFRYTPDMFVDTPLKNKVIEYCYMDNTYLNKVYENIPTREFALKEIISLIEIKKEQIKNNQPESNLLIKIILKKLGKEDMLISLASHFKTKVVCSKTRFNRYVNVLELNKEYFCSKFQSDSFIFVQDNDTENGNDLEGLNDIKNKHFVIIEPSALIPCSNRPKTLRALNEFYSKSTDNYFRIPYTDHSSYNELIEFVKMLKPKRVIPIVRQLMPNETKTDDLYMIERFLNKSPLIETKNSYRFLLSTRSSSSLLSGNTSRRCRSGPNSKNFVMRRISNRISKKKGVNYEDSPEKDKVKHTSTPLVKTIKKNGKPENTGKTLSSVTGEKSDKENGQNNKNNWEKLNDLVDIKAISFSESESESENNSSILTRSKLTNISNAKMSPASVRSSLKKSNHEEPISSKVTPIKSVVILDSSLSLKTVSSTKSSTQLEKKVNTADQSEFLPNTLCPTNSQSIFLNLSLSASLDNTNEASPLENNSKSITQVQQPQQHQKQESVSENADSFSDCQTNADKESLKSILIEHTESDFIDKNTKNDTNTSTGVVDKENFNVQDEQSKSSYSKDDNEAFESCNEDEFVTVKSPNKKKEVKNEFNDFYNFFEERFSSQHNYENKSEDQDANLRESCHKLMHEWVLNAFDF